MLLFTVPLTRSNKAAWTTFRGLAIGLKVYSPLDTGHNEHKLSTCSFSSLGSRITRNVPPRFSTINDENHGKLVFFCDMHIAIFCTVYRCY